MTRNLMLCGVSVPHAARPSLHEPDILFNIARVLIEKQSPHTVLEEVVEFRQAYQKLYYCFDRGLPA